MTSRYNQLLITRTVFSEVRIGCVTGAKYKMTPFQLSNPNPVLFESTYTVSTVWTEMWFRNFTSCEGSHATLSRIWAPELARIGISNMSWSVVKQVFAGRSDGKLFNQFCRKQGFLRLSLSMLHAYPLAYPFTLGLMAPGYLLLSSCCHGLSCPGCVYRLAGGVRMKKGLCCVSATQE